ncbi:MAG TPA: CapA family protein [Acidimicrobiales bacterium]|nr:CapA family protein [Acidimicrobiales bacterium]
MRRRGGAVVGVLALLLALAGPFGLHGPARAAPAEQRVPAFGAAPVLLGEVPDDAVGAAPTPSGQGLLTAGTGGDVIALGDAVARGGVGGPLNAPALDLVGTPSGRGYWLVARDGGVFSFGDASFFGSTGDVRLNEPIVGMAAAPSGRGYWLVARDGGVFSFGDASFFGSAAGRLPAGTAAASIEPRPTGDGYWIVAGGRRVRVALAGDVHAERHLGDEVRAGGNPLREVAPLLQAADIAAVNLETPAGSPGPRQSKEFVFLAPPELLTAIRSAGVDVVSLANNHALDHGAGAMLDTLRRAREAGLATVGAGADAAEAFRPAFLDVRGRRVAVIGLSRVVPPGWAATASRPGVASAYDERAALGAVRSAAASADHVVVLVHWGVELARCPGSDVVGLADRLHGAGAAVVAGHHPHVLQGVQAGPDRVTAYSLGNFVWYHDRPPSDLTGVLDVTLSSGVAGPGAEVAFHPARIGGDGHPRPLSGDEAEAVRRSVLGGACRRS